MSRFTASSQHLGKRKRRVSDLPRDTINPLSHSPGVLKQFRTSGLPDTEYPPSERFPSFPHSALGESTRKREKPTTHTKDNLDTIRAVALGSDDFTSTGNYSAEESLLGALKDAAQLLNSKGETGKAGKVTAALIRAHAERNQGHPSKRYYPRWALGVELLLREQGAASETTEYAGEETGPPAASSSKFRGYVTTLISLYPWGLRPPQLTSAVDFWRALLSAKVYGVYAEELAALQRTQLGMREGEGSSAHSSNVFPKEGGSVLPTDSPVADALGLGKRASDSPHRGRDQHRFQAIEAMRAIVADLGSLVTSGLHKKDRDLLHLYGMSLLYLADLETAGQSKEQAERSGSIDERLRLREDARECFATLLQLGAPLDPRLEHLDTRGDVDN